MTDDIIRKFLDLHPDTPINDKQYAVPLWVIRRMLETAETAEREECAYIADQGFRRAAEGDEIADLIRARGRSEALTNLNKAAEDMGQEL
jgi:hypothetical protein